MFANQKIPTPKWAFLFAGHLFVFELMTAWFKFSRGPVRFSNLTRLNLFEIFPVWAWFEIRCLTLYVIVALGLYLLEWIYGVQRRAPFYFLILLYVTLYILVRQPQLFDEFTSFSPLIRTIVNYSQPNFIYSLGLVCILYLNWTFWQTRPQRWPRWVLASAVSILLLYYVVCIQSLNPAMPAAEPHAIAKMQTTTNRPPIIIVSVDSLRPDTSLALGQTGGVGFQKFIKQSYHFTRTTTSLARTHASFSALFTAKIPPHNGIRSNLPKEILDTDRFLEGSLLAQLKQAGYRIELFFDTRQYAHFGEGHIITHSEGPPSGVKSLLFPHLFQSRLFAGLFNNTVGRILLPEVSGNGAYLVTDALTPFQEKVRARLRMLAEQNEPTVLIIHTCGIHWPGALPYPYYPRADHDIKGGALFAYTSTLPQFKDAVDHATWLERAQFNRRIYDSAVQMITEHFVTPVFDTLKETGALEHSIVGFMSDHGEDFWTEGEFPESRPVLHGSSLLFGAQSEEAVLRLSFPGQEGGEIKQRVGLIDVLPTLFDYLKLPHPPVDGHSLLSLMQNHAQEDRPYYVETDVWPYRFFRGQWLTTTPASLAAWFSYDPVSQLVFTNPEFASGSILQKQRAVYLGDYRLSLYRTWAGSQLFLCDRAHDLGCEENLVLREPQKTNILLEALLRFSQADIANELIPLQKRSTSAQLVSDVDDAVLMAHARGNPLKYQWQVAARGLELMHRWHDDKKAVDFLDWVLTTLGLDSELKSLVQSQLLDACSQGIFDEEHAPMYLKVYRPTFNMHDFNATTWETPKEIKCMGFLGRTQIVANYQAHLKRLADVQPTAKLNWLQTQQKWSVAELHPILIRLAPESRARYRLLEELYYLSNGPEKQNYRAQLTAHPLYGKQSRSLLIDDALNGPGDKTPQERVQQALRLFRTQIAYDLPWEYDEELERIFEWLVAHDRNAALLFGARQLATMQLPLAYFNLLLSHIDQMIPQTPHLRALRPMGWAKGQQDPTVNIQALETSLALVRLEQYFCQSHQQDACRETKSLAESMPLATWARTLETSLHPVGLPLHRTQMENQAPPDFKWMVGYLLEAR